MIPLELIKPDNIKENRLWKYGIKYWNEYFDDRQLLVMASFLKNIKEICKSIEDEKYRSVIALYLTAISFVIVL